MTLARNSIADLCAIAAMPGIEELAEIIAPYLSLIHISEPTRPY